MAVGGGGCVLINGAVEYAPAACGVQHPAVPGQTAIEHGGGGSVGAGDHEDDEGAELGGARADGEMPAGALATVEGWRGGGGGGRGAEGGRGGG